ALVNFEITFDRINLFLGENGSGKSSVFEVLNLLRQFMIDSTLRVSDLFKVGDLTRWITSPEQRFELNLETSDGLYLYQLLLEYNRTYIDEDKWRVRI